MELLGTHFNDISQNAVIYNQENAIENVVCKMLAIVLMPCQWQLMTWQYKEPGHQQPCCWPSYPRIFHLSHQKGWNKLVLSIFMIVSLSLTTENALKCVLDHLIWDKLTLNMLNCFKVYKNMYSHFVSYLGFFVQQKKTKFTTEQPYTCCLYYTVNTMPADALATSESRASAGMVLIK